MFTNIPAYGFLRLPQVLAIFPISKSAWWEGCRTMRGKFSFADFEFTCAMEQP